MKKTFISLIMLTAVMICSPSINLYAVESRDVDYSFGKVVKVSQNLITLSEIIYSETDEDAEMLVNYIIDSETELDNVDSLEEITPDDELEITYFEQEGQKIAVRIHKFQSFEWEEEKEAEQLSETYEDFAYDLKE